MIFIYDDITQSFELFYNKLFSNLLDKYFIEEISPSRTEIRALPVSAFTQVLNNKFRREFVGKKTNFELFDKAQKVITTEETGVFFTVDTYPEKQTGLKRAIPGTALVTISKSPSAFEPIVKPESLN